LDTPLARREEIHGKESLEMIFTVSRSAGK